MNKIKKLSVDKTYTCQGAIVTPLNNGYRNSKGDLCKMNDRDIDLDLNNVNDYEEYGRDMNTGMRYRYGFEAGSRSEAGSRGRVPKILRGFEGGGYYKPINFMLDFSLFKIKV